MQGGVEHCWLFGTHWEVLSVYVGKVIQGGDAYSVTISDGPVTVTIIVWVFPELLVTLNEVGCCLVDATGCGGNAGERRHGEGACSTHSE